MIDELKQAATAAGATEVIYDRDQMANILVDKKTGVISLIGELNNISQQIMGNGIAETITLQVAFVQQVDFQDTAENNRDVMSDMLKCTRRFILHMQASGIFRDIRSTTTKHEENSNDANLIGWRMNITTKLDGYAECL